MSGGIIMNTVRQFIVCACAFSIILSVDAYGAQAAKNAAKSSPVAVAAKTSTNAKGAAKAANKATPTAAKQQSKALTPPPMVGVQSVAAPDKAKSLVPDKSKLIASAKSFTEAVSEQNKAKNPKGAKAAPKKKVVKARKHVVDVKVLVWGRTPEEAEALAIDASRKMVGSKDRYLVKDTVFLVDSSKVICMMRINFTDEIPENWYLETEMVTGFGKTREKAYSDALIKAIGKTKIVQNTSDWLNTQSSVKNSTDMGVIPYEYTFATLNKEHYCKLYFRYFMPR